MANGKCVKRGFLWRCVARREAITADLRAFIKDRDGLRCRYCGARGEHVFWHIDHVVPVIAGGTNDPGNLVLACAQCNSAKKDLVPPGWTTRRKIRNYRKQRFNELGKVDRNWRLRGAVAGVLALGGGAAVALDRVGVIALRLPEVAPFSLPFLS
jgi:hypothetical protein